MSSCQRSTRRKIANGANPSPISKQSKHFSKFLGDEVITFRVGDKLKPIQAHKNVICEKLEVFDAMLRGNFSEATSKVIDLPEDNFDAFELLVEWCYTNRINMANENTSYSSVNIRVELYCLAHKYCALVLQDFVTNYLITWFRIKDGHVRLVQPQWIARIEETFSASYDELGGIEELPGPLRFFIRFLNSMVVLASQPKPSKLAKMYLEPFPPEQLEHWRSLFPGVPVTKNYKISPLISEPQIIENWNSSSTTCCEYHNHISSKILECPVFKEIRGTAKYSPDAFVVVANFKRRLGSMKVLERTKNNRKVTTELLRLTDEINMKGTPFNTAQANAGLLELFYLGVFAFEDGQDEFRTIEFKEGMGIQQL
ncbi:hypothetical protein BCON_0093g00270 [Botryotinia convoluta]|uniref:BTB domain-containing protein n=1 Tax=Botryotinia convoluta TaxID=54673 RepID=A0A4Z1I3P6_9HELO|nr:hypothetical protein BCON_0093g00270 [Botryotinia convoluta]